MFERIFIVFTTTIHTCLAMMSLFTLIGIPAADLMMLTFLGTFGAVCLLNAFELDVAIHKQYSITQACLVIALSLITWYVAPLFNISLAASNLIMLSMFYIVPAAAATLTYLFAPNRAAENIVPAEQEAPEVREDPLFRFQQAPLFRPDFFRLNPVLGGNIGNFIDGQANIRDRAFRNIAQQGVYQPLTNEQTNALNVMRDKYKDELKERTRDTVMAEIKAAIIASYNASPAELDKQNLPIDHNPELATQVPYYKHAVHGAYRYLFLRPNPWIQRTVLTVQVGNGHAADINEENYNDIAYMWLMANDENQAMPEGYDREALKTEFFHVLSDLNRAHNRDDRYRDNNQADTPTCPRGILQRTTQYLMLFLDEKPELRPLDSKIILTRFKEALINESAKANGIYAKLQKMTPAELKEVDSALKFLNIEHLGNWAKLSKAQTKCLKQLDLNQVEIDQFIKETKVAFTPKRITDKHPEQIRYQEHKFATFEELIKHLVKQDVTLMQFHGDITRHIEQLLLKKSAKPNAPLRFSQKNKENKRSAANKDATKRKRNVI